MEEFLQTILCRQNRAAIYSYASNPQGLAKHPTTGAIWDQEHGPKGGDEINIIKKGALWMAVVTYVSIMMARPLATKPKAN
jgi:hypothetical protein